MFVYKRGKKFDFEDIFDNILFSNTEADLFPVSVCVCLTRQEIVYF